MAASDKIVTLVVDVALIGVLVIVLVLAAGTIFPAAKEKTNSVIGAGAAGITGGGIEAADRALNGMAAGVTTSFGLPAPTSNQQRPGLDLLEWILAPVTALFLKAAEGFVKPAASTSDAGEGSLQGSAAANYGAPAGLSTPLSFGNYSGDQPDWNQIA